MNHQYIFFAFFGENLLYEMCKETILYKAKNWLDSKYKIYLREKEYTKKWVLRWPTLIFQIPTCKYTIVYKFYNDGNYSFQSDFSQYFRVHFVLFADDCLFIYVCITYMQYTFFPIILRIFYIFQLHKFYVCRLNCVYDDLYIPIAI